MTQFRILVRAKFLYHPYIHQQIVSKQIKTSIGSDSASGKFPGLGSANNKSTSGAYARKEISENRPPSKQNAFFDRTTFLKSYHAEKDRTPS